MSTPDPQIVREIATEHLAEFLSRYPNADPFFVGSRVLEATGDPEMWRTDRDAYVAWCDAVAAEIRAAVPSWPDEQQQDGAAASELAAFIDAWEAAELPNAVAYTARASRDGERPGIYRQKLTVQMLRTVLDERDALAARVAKLESELRSLRGTELNPSPTILNAQDYEYLRDEIAATMTDDWDGDEAESWILVRYVRWLAAGQPRDEDGYPIRRETHPAADLAAEREARKADVRAVAALQTAHSRGSLGWGETVALFALFADRIAALTANPAQDGLSATETDDKASQAADIELEFGKPAAGLSELEPCDGDCDCDCQPGQPCLCPERDCYCGPCRVCDRDEVERQRDDTAEGR